MWLWRRRAHGHAQASRRLLALALSRWLATVAMLASHSRARQQETSRPSSRPTSGSGPLVPVLRVVATPIAWPGLAPGAQPVVVVTPGQNPGISRAARARVGVNNMSYTVNSASGTESASCTHASSLDIEYSVHWFGRNGHMPFWEGDCYMSVRIKFSGDKSQSLRESPFLGSG